MRAALRCLAVALLAPALLPAVSFAATVEVDSELRLLRITGDATADRISVEETSQFYIVTREGGGLTSPAGCTELTPLTQFSCPRQASLAIDLDAGADTLTTTRVTDPISVFGGDGADTLSGGAGIDVLAGGAGNDALNGLGGVDDYFGQGDDDTIESTDGVAERLSCGAGDDQVHNDFVDILAECERGIDGDRDGFTSAVDCNDASAVIFPGARETLENGVDEDCDGRDAVNLDRDGDGFPVPADCNDGDRAIRPGAPETKGNAVDENCDSRAEPFALLRALVLNNWQVAGATTRLRRLQVRNAPKDARIVFRCSGRSCPTTRARVRTVPRDLAPITLDSGFRRADLRAGTRLTVEITAAGTVGRTYSYTVKRAELPAGRTTCRVARRAQEPDVLSRRLTLIIAALLALLAPGTARAGLFTVEQGTIIYRADPGDSDQIAGFDIGTSIRFTRFGEAGLGAGDGCTASGDFQTIDCTKANVTAVVLNLGDGDDVAVVSTAVTIPVIFNGGDGADALFGGGGIDIFNGGAQNDNVVARDGRPEQVDCGSGLDTAITDDADARLAVEEVEGDADADGVRRPSDCDDTKPAVHPGAVDVPDNGIDEDCSGVDAVQADRDRDGTPRPQDCNDGDAAVRPGLREAIGNDVDENCDGRIDPFPPITGAVSNAWRAAGSGTRNVLLAAKRFPPNTAVELRCTGRRCPFTVVRRRVGARGRAVDLHGPFRGRGLPPGTRIELRLTIARRIGRVLRYTIRAAGDAPDVDFLCLPPGGRPRGC